MFALGVVVGVLTLATAQILLGALFFFVLAGGSRG